MHSSARPAAGCPMKLSRVVRATCPPTTPTRRSPRANSPGPRSSASKTCAATPGAGSRIIRPATPTKAMESGSLREETRYLGRVLGQVLRDQTGTEGYERSERIRQEAVAFRRAERGEAEAARARLEGHLNALSRDQTLDVVRAFSYFLHLLNVAEDRQTNRLALQRERENGA